MNPSSNQDCRWGILGCGNIAHTFARSALVSEHGALLACAARDKKRAKDFAAQYSIHCVYDSYSELAKSNDIDAVYIATTHNFHFEHIVMCLMQDKHVLCEKPLTINAKQARVVQALAKERGLLLMEAVWTRFLPAIHAIQTVIENRTIGKVTSMYVNFSIQAGATPSHRLMSKALAGGALLDLGIYPISLADLVFNEKPCHIAARANIGSTEVDESSHYMLGYSSGATAMLSASFVQSAPIEAMIFGDKGYIKIPHFLGAKGFDVFVDGEQQVHHEHDYNDDEPFVFEINHFQECLASGVLDSPVLPLDKSISILEIMDDIRAEIGLQYEADVD